MAGGRTTVGGGPPSPDRGGEPSGRDGGRPPDGGGGPPSPGGERGPSPGRGGGRGPSGASRLNPGNALKNRGGRAVDDRLSPGAQRAARAARRLANPVELKQYLIKSAVAVTILAILILIATVLLAVIGHGAMAQTEAACNGAGGAPVGATPGEGAKAIPKKPYDLLKLYQDAERKYGVPWSILAAINRVETHFGLNLDVSSKGAVGWMQFMPGTWAQYGVDGSGDGRADPWDPLDAIPSAANYLRALAAGRDWHDRDTLHDAIFGYNHSESYVQSVLDWAKTFVGAAPTPDTTPTASPATGQQPSDEDAAAGCDGTGDGIVVPPGTRLAKIISIAGQIDEQQIPYCWAGGHPQYYPGVPTRPSRGDRCHTKDHPDGFGPGTGPGLDCSSAVSMLLQLAGYHIPTMTSGQFKNWGTEAKPGALMTIHASAGHVYVVINGRFWGTSLSNHLGGPGWHGPRSDPPSDHYVVREPPGL